MSGILYLDIFSGCAGFHLAARKAGLKIKKSVHIEINKFSNRVYNYHFPFSKGLGDIRDVKPKEIISRLGGRPNFATFGWPCTDNSIAGKRKGQKRGNRSGLIYEAVRLLSKLQPECFLAENVPGLAKNHSGVDFIETMRILSEMGTNSSKYTVECFILDSRDWTGQSRQRYYFCGCLGQKSPGMVFSIKRTDTVHVKAESDSPKVCVDCFTATFGRSRWKTESTFILEKDGRLRQLSVLEFERFQGFPDDWTKWGLHEKKKEKVKMSIYQRYRMLGDSITVPVIVDILEKMKEAGFLKG